MGTLLIILNQITHQAEGMVMKEYGRRHGDGGMFFNAIVCLFSMIFFVMTDRGGFCFPKALWGYGIISCIMFAAGFYSTYVALQLGSYAITKLVSSFSGVIAIGYGILFLKEPADLKTYLAFGLVFLSVFMMNYTRESAADKAEKKLSVKWIVCVAITLISNGLIAVISRMQQIRFEHAYDNEFMILSLGGASAALILFGFLRERGRLTGVLKYGSLYGMAAGLLNGAQNLLNLYLLIYIPISIATSLKTGIGIITSFAVSCIIYKEKFTRQQLASAAVGLLALLMLNCS